MKHARRINYCRTMLILQAQYKYNWMRNYLLLIIIKLVIGISGYKICIYFLLNLVLNMRLFFEKFLTIRLVQGYVLHNSWYVEWYKFLLLFEQFKLMIYIWSSNYHPPIDFYQLMGQRIVNRTWMFKKYAS